MDYLKMLEHSYERERETAYVPPEPRLEYLGEYIFDFTTYDSDMSAEFARKAVEVCNAINTRTTFDYIADAANYRWFLLMCNMPFFADRLDWGTSIRGAFWKYGPIEHQCYGLWDGDKQLADPMKYTTEQWAEFCLAVVEFADPEMGL